MLKIICHTVACVKRLNWSVLLACMPGGGRGGGYSLIWPIQGCAAGQGMVFVLSVLNRVYNFARVCPKQGQFPFKSVQNSLHDLRECVCTFKKQ